VPRGIWRTPVLLYSGRATRDLLRAAGVEVDQSRTGNVNLLAASCCSRMGIAQALLTWH
jgi:hypothetical protein